MMKTGRRNFLKTIPGAALAGSGGSLLAAMLGGCSRERPPRVQGAIPDDPRTRWYRQAKFGMFIHWGAYSVAGVEASWPIMKPEWFPESKAISEAQYVDLPKSFNPVQFDPYAWVQQAKRAGMRYMVFTTKHHDGFCMFDAPGTDYKITNTPYGKDVLAMLADACQKEQMPLGLYYSPPDMHHPGYRDTSKPVRTNWNGEPARPEWKTYLDYMESHLRVLLTHYGPVAILWFDGLFGQNKYDPPRFHKLIHELSPATLINDRLGPGGDYITPEQFIPGGIPIKRKKPPADISPDAIDTWAALGKILPQSVFTALTLWMVRGRYPTSPYPAPDEFQLWETCMTMNDSWGYNPSDEHFKSAGRLIRTLVEVASRGGNFLLNVGPSPEGTFPPESTDRLEEIGEWMRRNGDAIHGTQYGPVQGLPFARTTQKGDTTYLEVLDWQPGSMEVRDMQRKISAVSLLANGEVCPFEQSDDRLKIAVPAQPPDTPVSVLAIRENHS